MIYVSYRRHRVSRPRIGSVLPHLDCPANESADHKPSSSPRKGSQGPIFTMLYWVLTQTHEIGRICLAGIAPAHISPLSEFSQGISPGSPTKGLPICGNWSHPATRLIVAPNALTISTPFFMIHSIVGLSII